MRVLSLTRVLILAAVAASTASASAETKSLALTAEQVRSLGIKVEPVRPAKAEVIAVLPGTVVPPLNSRIVATAPFAGTVTQVHVLPGQRVNKGAPVATISSRELLDVQSQLSQAEAELQMAEAIARRKRLLVDKKFQNPVVAEEAEAQVAKIKAVIEQHKKKLSLNGISLGQDGKYSIPAAQDGTVVEVKAMPGDMIDAMDAVVTVDTSNELWVEVQVPASLVAVIKPGSAIQVVGGPNGRVVSVGTALQGMTRSALLYAAIPTSSGLMAGQLVSVQLQRPAVPSALSVPAKAVARIAGKSAVFVRSDAGFTIQTVELRGRPTQAATIVGDLPPDAQVAASGLPQLEQMLQGK
ncbi:MAG: efflux RND transporter periplasmic adaptor subunit [Pseudolabrys sp.]|jgi:cobalt-zinc-cadmium efflux system membrane fusion protein